MMCRFCKKEIKDQFIDLVNSPPSNSYVSKAQLNEPEIYYPLKVLVCEHCLLVQVDEYKKSDEIFNADYAYFSSMSSSWLDHASRYVNMISAKLNLHGASQVIEIASNDGYLLQYFQQKGVPCLGVEPTKSTADVARSKGIKVVEDFFGVRLAPSLPKADLILGNNVLAHVPDINDFVQGLKLVLKDSGTITMEFPHLMNLMRLNQFDTIYHEHFSYLSLITTARIFAAHGLQVFDVEELPTHGGSLRIYARHAGNGEISPAMQQVLEKEKERGLHTINGYHGFQQQANQVKLDFLRFLIQAKDKKQVVAGYGAAAKGNTLLNYCGVKGDLIEFVVDRAPLKCGRYMPGSHIPIVSEERIREAKPAYVIIFPWNIKEEVMAQLSYIREWGGKFVVAVPGLEVL